MKIGMVVPGGVDRSGTHRVIPCLLWIIERVARKHELHVFALRQEPEPSTYALRGATIHNIGLPPRGVRALRTILREHGRAPFDVLHGVWAWPQGVIAGLAGLRLGVPVLLRVTGGDLALHRDIDFGLLSAPRGPIWLRLATSLATEVTVPSSFMAQRATEQGLRVRRLPFGVALDEWPPRAPVTRKSSGPFRLLHVGSLNRVKDHTTLLRAARHLKDRGASFFLDIVGQDTMEGALQDLARTLELADRTRFHGFLPHGDLRPLMERADLLLITSRHEADPVVALEAAVAGVPVVGTPVGHLVDWAPDGAALFGLGDARALAGLVQDLIEDPQRRLELARSAQARVLREDADWSAEQLLELYERLNLRRATS